MRTVFSIICQRRYFPVYLLSVLVLLANCKGDDNGPTPSDDLTAQQKRAQDLVGTWASVDTGITTDANDIEDAAQQELEALTMIFGVNNNTDFTPGSFSSAGAATYFDADAQAEWSWAGMDSTNVSDVELSAVAPVATFTIEPGFTENSMTISFDFDGASTGRFAGIGQYSIQMTKQ